MRWYNISIERMSENTEKNMETLSGKRWYKLIKQKLWKLCQENSTLAVL